MVEGEDLLGDGVNVAARLEGISEPGGICISERVYEDIRNKPEIVAGITRAYGGFGSRWNSLFFVRPMWYLHPSEPPAMPGGHIELESECY